MQSFTNKTKSRILFKIKTGYKQELLSPETMEILGNAKKYVDKDIDASAFVPSKQFGQLVTISPHSLTVLKSTSTKFQSVE